MKEPYEEELAIHFGPESYAGDGDIAGVARTGVHAGQPLSSEIIRACPDKGKATHSRACWQALLRRGGV